MDGFCSHCNQAVQVKFLETTKLGKIRGKEVTYKTRDAVCSVCGEPVTYQGEESANQDALKDTFREQEGLISVSEIEELLNKYKIGKRPLSLLLGWGEGTLTRYLNGDLPTRQYSGTLKRIKDDPEYYREVLEENRKAITYQAYSKSKKALELLGYADQQMTVESICSEPLEKAAAQLLSQEPTMGEDKLQILLYYLQGFHLAFRGGEMFPEDCIEDNYIPKFLQIAELFPTGKLHNRRDLAEENVFTAVEEIFIETVVNSLGRYNAATLRTWILAERFASERHPSSIGDAESDLIIGKSEIADHFKSIRTKFQMISVLDIVEYQRSYDRK